MLKSTREKAILKQGIIVIGALAGLYFFVLVPFLKEGSSILDEELERKTKEIKRYISRTGSMPSKESFDMLEKQNTELVEKYSEIASLVDPQKVRIPESSSELGLYFIERLHTSMKRFSQVSSEKGITIPDNLGFSEGLPKDAMVDMLLRQLEIVEIAMDVLLQSQSINFSTIKPLKSIEYIEPLSKKLLYTELPVQISFKTDTRSLVNLLLELKNKTPVISVKEFHIKTVESETEEIEASLVLSVFKLEKDT